MKKYVALALALLVAPAFAQEADAPKKPEGDRKARMEQHRAKMLEKYDKDGDGKLSESEREAMRKDNPRGQRGNRGPGGEERRAKMLEKYDKDGDGKLSEDERKAMMEDRKKAREARGGDKASS